MAFVVGAVACSKESAPQRQSGPGSQQLAQVDFFGTGDAAECQEVVGVLVHQVELHPL